MRRTSSSTSTIRSGVTLTMSGSSTKASWVLVPEVGIVEVGTGVPGRASLRTAPSSAEAMSSNAIGP